MTFQLSPTSPLVIAQLICFTLAPISPAQTGDLSKDIPLLDIRHRTDHYDLAGTVSQDRFEEYGRCLEYIFREYSTGFEELIQAEPAGTKPNKASDPRRASKKEKDENAARPSSPAAATDRFTVVVFSTPEAYEEFVSRYFRGRAEHTRGLYVPTVRLLLIRDAQWAPETYEVLFHEAFHQFLHRYIPSAPVWVNEGLATYYGTARPSASGLNFGPHESYFFQIVAAAASARELIPFPDLLRASSSQFYNTEQCPRSGLCRQSLHYAQSYTLVTFMLTSDDGREHLRTYLRNLAGAKSADAARVTAESFPPDLLERLVPGWIAYVNRQ